MRSTSMRSTPTIMTSCTGKSSVARWSTARCASSYVAYEPIGHPVGGVGRRGGTPGRFGLANGLVTGTTSVATR
jgi:hypothetical protein